MSFSKSKLAAMIAGGLVMSSAAYAEDPMVGGMAMFASKNIVENASAAPNLTTLVAAVKQAGLVQTLEGSGPFTVFAPTNEAFDAVGKNTLDSLMKPDNKDKLTKILTYHVVAGDYDAAKLKQLVNSGNGQAKLKTVEGDELTFKTVGQGLTVTDDKDNTAEITTPDVKQSNGEVHVINKVLTP